MADPPRRSLPSSAGDVQLRRLGSAKAADSPIRGQVVVGFVVALVAIGVPMYFMRRPNLDAPAPVPSAAKPALPVGVKLSPIDAGAPKPRVRLGSAQRIQCGASPKQRGNEGPQCDPLPVFEHALKRAILAQVDCAPAVGEGSINFVLNINFANHSLNVFPGKSGSWYGPQAKKAAACVEKAIAPIKWETVAHRYRFYTLAVSATYAQPSVKDQLPTFE
ncbi:MAG TPA: hypothetical protein VL137_00310 [Polyangiaceae bacterium]|jgi:hypothetical protein|nr:hypothetical protein [Polyangiaceae bacterium]